jgi:hypothetical protein
MYTLIKNNKKNELITLKSKKQLLDKVRLIAKKDKFRTAPIDTIDDCLEYINEYTLDYELIKDSDVAKFLNNHAVEVEENEPDHYVELMMDDHKCTEWKGKQYYISDNLDLCDDEYKLYEVLAYTLHV